MKNNHQTTSSGSFFAVSRFRLISTVVLILMAVTSLTPWSFETRVGNVPVVNILLTAIMFVGLAVLVIDLVVTRESNVVGRGDSRVRDGRHG